MTIPRAREALAFHGYFLRCATFLLQSRALLHNAARIEIAETPSISNDVQASENARKKRVLNYKSPALTAEVQARRAATREHRIFNVQRPIFTARTGWRVTAANQFINYLDVRQRCGPFLNEGVELVQVDRFYQVMVETCLAAFADIFFHSETSERNS